MMNISFFLCVLSFSQKLTYKLHPDALLQIVRCLMTLMRSGHVLHKLADKQQVIAHLKELFEKY